MTVEPIPAAATFPRLRTPGKAARVTREREAANDLRCELQNAAPEQRDRVAQLGELSL
jgi:hypothetical protein